MKFDPRKKKPSKPRDKFALRLLPEIELRLRARIEKDPENRFGALSWEICRALKVFDLTNKSHRAHVPDMRAMTPEQKREIRATSLVMPAATRKELEAASAAGYGSVNELINGAVAAWLERPPTKRGGFGYRLLSGS